MPPKRGQETITSKFRSSVYPSKSQIERSSPSLLHDQAHNLLNKSSPNDSESKQDVQNLRVTSIKAATISSESLEKSDKERESGDGWENNTIRACTRYPSLKFQPEPRRIGIFSKHPHLPNSEHKSAQKTHHLVNNNASHAESRPFLQEKHVATEFNDKIRCGLQHPQYFSEYAQRFYHPLSFERRNIPMLTNPRRFSNVDEDDIFSMAEEDSKRSFRESVTSLLTALEKKDRDGDGIQEKKNGDKVVQERGVNSRKVHVTDLLQSIVDENQMNKIKKLEKSIYKRK